MIITDKSHNLPKPAGEIKGISRLLPRHFTILDLMLAGHSNKAIAETVGMSTVSISTITASPLFQHELAKRRAKLNEVGDLDRNAYLAKSRSILEKATERAANVQVELLEDDDSSIRLRASTNILDRVFGKSDDSRPVVITAEQINLLNIAAKESDNEGYGQSPANSTDADASEDEHVDVCEEGNPSSEDV